MERRSLLILIVAILHSPCFAQEWADKMFEARSYDFGNIARGAKAEFAFELTNLYLEEVHIVGVRASCGCTTPRIEKDTLKTYEKGSVIAHINSDRFLGNQRATITLTIDRPQYAQVRLHVKVHIFSDVLLEPSSVVLGSVPHGSSPHSGCGQHLGFGVHRLLDVHFPLGRPPRDANYAADSVGRRRDWSCGLAGGAFFVTRFLI
jgi:hypothetical protein